MARNRDNPVVGILECPCGKHMKVRRNAVGRPGKCKRCGRIIRADADALLPVPESLREREQASASAPGLDAGPAAGGGAPQDWGDDPFATPESAQETPSGLEEGYTDPGLDAEDPATSSTWDRDAAGSWDDDDDGLFDVPLEETAPGDAQPEPVASDDWIGEETPQAPLPIAQEPAEPAAAEGSAWDDVAPVDAEEEDDPAASGTTWDAVAPPSDPTWDVPQATGASSSSPEVSAWDSEPASGASEWDTAADTVPGESDADNDENGTETSDAVGWHDASSAEDDDDDWLADVPDPPEDAIGSPVADMGVGEGSWSGVPPADLGTGSGGGEVAPASAPAPWDSLDDQLESTPEDDTADGGTFANAPATGEDAMAEWYDEGEESDLDFSAGPQQPAWERRRTSSRKKRQTSAPARAATGGEGRVGKRRIAALIFPLSAITFGIYYLYWVYVTFAELRDAAPREKSLHPLLALLLHFAPVISFFWGIFVPIRMVIEARDVQMLQGREPSGSPLAVGAALVFGPLTMLIGSVMSLSGGDMAIFALIAWVAGMAMVWIGLAQAQSAVNQIYAD